MILRYAFPNDPHKLDGDGNGIACESLPRKTGEKSIATQPTRQSTPQIQASATVSTQMKLGNPSNANTSDLNNYLLKKPQFVIGYNCSKGIPNWASWQLNERMIEITY